MRYSIFILGLLIWFCQCKAQEFTPDNYDGPMIIFGKGGGFTGKVKEYCLMSDGSLFKDSNIKEDMSKMDPIDKERANQIFDAYKALKLNQLDLDSPGNNYSYIIMRNGNSEHKLQWGSQNAKPSKEVKIFFSNLQHLMKEQNSNSQ